MSGAQVSDSETPEDELITVDSNVGFSHKQMVTGLEKKLENWFGMGYTNIKWPEQNQA